MAKTTRYQILYDDGKKPIENFSSKAKFEARVKALQKKKVAFSTWDTRKNSLSKSFGGL